MKVQLSAPIVSLLGVKHLRFNSDMQLVTSGLDILRIV